MMPRSLTKSDIFGWRTFNDRLCDVTRFAKRPLPYSRYVEPQYEYSEYASAVSELVNDLLGQFSQPTLGEIAKGENSRPLGIFLPKEIEGEWPACAQELLDFACDAKSMPNLGGEWGCDVLHLALAACVNNVLTESGVPCTQIFIDVPKQPNRDHHLGHVLAVLLVGEFILNQADAHSFFVRKLESTELVKALKDAGLLNGLELKDIVMDAWLIAALCHDGAYPIEMGHWVRGAMRLSRFPMIEQSSDISLKQFDDAVGSLQGNRNVERFSLKQVKHYFMDEVRKHIKDYLARRDRPDHGVEMATMMLRTLASRAPVEALPMAILAIEAIALHSRIGDVTQDDEQIRNWASTHPFPLFLSMNDHFGECSRIHWAIVDIKPWEGERSVCTTRVELSEVDGERERAVAFGGIIGIPEISLKVNKEVLKAEYAPRFERYGMICGGSNNLYDTKMAIDSPRRIRFLTTSLKQLTDLMLEHVVEPEHHE
jgi:hypothetical protein